MRSFHELGAENTKFNAREYSAVINDKVIYCSPGDFMPCWNYSDRTISCSSPAQKLIVVEISVTTLGGGGHCHI
jgi:hypothetical protein